MPSNSEIRSLQPTAPVLMYVVRSLCSWVGWIASFKSMASTRSNSVIKPPTVTAGRERDGIKGLKGLIDESGALLGVRKNE